MPAAVDGLKECPRCGETKPVSEYNKNKSTSDGLQHACRSCQKKRYENNKEKVTLTRAKYYQANKEAFARRAAKSRYGPNREKILERQRQYYHENREYFIERKKEQYEANREYYLEYAKEYFQKLPAAVYKIENKITGKIYIGQSTQYSVRWTQHRFKMRHGKHHCLQHDYDKYGIESFEFSVIQEYPCDTDSDTLLQHERRAINQYLAEGKELYNILGITNA
jgi:hypothetical protein